MVKVGLGPSPDSVDVREPGPYRPVPSDFAGPVCVECRHSWIPEYMTVEHRRPGPRDYRCGAIEPEVERPAERDPITGKVHGPVLKYADCVDHNGSGQCTRFEPKSKVVALRTPAKPDAHVTARVRPSLAPLVFSISVCVAGLLAIVYLAFGP